MRWKHVGALALPFAIGAGALRLVVAPAGDRIAGAVALAAPASPSARAVAQSPLAAAVVDDGAMDNEPSVAPPARGKRTSSRLAGAHRAGAAPEGARDAGTDAARAPSPPSLTGPTVATLVVPAAAVTRALERRDVGARNAVAPDGSPLGARLIGVSRYRTGLRDGDVIVSVAGTRTPTVEAVVLSGSAAAGGGAKSLSGRILRGDALYAVVVELPQ